MSRARRLLAGLLAAGVLLTATAGCAQSVDPIERLGRKAAQKVNGPHRAPAAGPGRTSESGPKADVRGDHEAPGSRVVTACGRRDRPRESADPGCRHRRGSGGRTGRNRTEPWTPGPGATGGSRLPVDVAGP